MFFTDFKPDDFLFAFILIGYILSKMKVSPDNSATVLSKLENFIFVPALVIGTFMEKCTPSMLTSTWRILLIGGIPGNLFRIYHIYIAFLVYDLFIWCTCFINRRGF